MNCGVYAIKNTANGKVYVGSSTRLRTRICNHKTDMKCGRHPNNHLRAAVQVYGFERFEIAVIEICSKEHVLLREQYWINTLDAFNSGYNQRPIASSCLGYAFTEERKAAQRLAMSRPEVRAKMSASAKNRNMTPEAIVERSRKISDANKGKKLTKEAREKLSAIAKASGRKPPGCDRTGSKLSPEHKAKVSEALRNRGPISEDTRAKLVATAKGRTPEYYARLHASLAAARALKKSLVDANAA
jgi:group I intron endonuclease